MTIYHEFLGREPYSTNQSADYRLYPAEWRESQLTANEYERSTFGSVAGGFTDAWFNLGIVNANLIAALISQRDSDDKNPEHLRYAAFQHFIASNRPLRLGQCWQIYDLGNSDPDLAMGGTMMANVLRLPECPRELLTIALASDRKHIVRIAKQRME